ncbi:Major Facilitator Superfamily protein [Actinobaculum suis]|uniref:MFS transporter n=1 Tax=Actinobaculum suis TaxID=1657 RepID=A0A1G7A3F2_9ACTO|nr:MFS transporter [Actinobaculum suis]MDY5152707.1 MFS transporter [Actinobaculum suis]SDE09424.1 Major Facilitator Superfamily protein [Actinobaculum suis]
MKLISDLKSLATSPGFLKLLSVRLVSQCGDGMFQVGLASLFFFNPARASDVGTVALSLVVMLLPFSLIGPFTGPFIDRWPRRQILLWGNILRAGLTAAILGVLFAQIDWLVYLLALITLGINRILLSTLSAGLPKVVESKERLLVANSIVPTLGGASTAIGAVLGFLLRLFLPTETGQQIGALIAAIALYCGGAAVASRLGRQELGPDKPVREKFGKALVSAARELGEGVRYLMKRGTPAAALTTMSLHRFVYGMQLITIILAGRNLYADPADATAGIASFGALMGAMVAGHGLSIVLTPLAHERMRPATWIVCCLLGGTAGQILIAASSEYVIVLAGIFIFGVGVQGAKIAVDTIVQADTHDRFRGRAFSIYDVLFNLAECVAAGVCVLVLPDIGWSRPVQISLIVFVWAVAALYSFETRRLGGQPRPVLPEEATSESTDPAPTRAVASQ